MLHWIFIAAIVLAISLASGLTFLAYAFEAVLLLLLASRVLARQWITSLTAERETSRVVADVGDTVSVVIRIRNRGMLPIPWCLVEDLLPRGALMFDPPNLGQKGRRTKLLMLAPRGTTELRYELQCNTRGYYQLGPTVLETGDLFGLHRRYRVAAAPHFLMVYPKVVPLLGYDVRSRRPLGDVRLTHRLFEDPTRIAGVRPYVAGDSIRRVHWQASARTGELHSKVYEPSAIAGLTLLLDFHQLSHDPRHEPFRSELAVTAAASLSQAVYEMGQQVGLVTNGRDAADRIRLQGWGFDMRTRDAARKAAEMLPESHRLQPLSVPTRVGADQLLRILATLARLELTDGLTLPQLVVECMHRLPRNATVVAIVPAVTDEAIVALTMLKRQGFVVAAVVNMFDDYDFAQASGPLLAVGIDTYQLKDEAGIASVVAPLVHSAAA